MIPVGYSTGGAIVASFLLESDLAAAVRAAVLEAPALQRGVMVNARAAGTSLPLLPVTVPMVLTITAKWFATRRFEVDWTGIDYPQPADRSPTPMLVVPGVDDDTVPFEIAERPAAARPDLVTLAAFETARHLRARNVDPGRYRAEIERFLDSLG